MIGARWLPVLLLMMVMPSLGGAMGDAQGGRAELAGSVVTYTWHSSPMAPVYRWVYVVRVEPGGSGSLKYEFGPSDGALGKTVKFQVGAGEYSGLLDALVREKVLDGEWAGSDRPLGAAQESLGIASASGKSVTIGSGLEAGAAGRFKAVVLAVRGCVPKDVWGAMEVEQKTYVAEHH